MEFKLSDDSLPIQALTQEVVNDLLTSEPHFQETRRRRTTGRTRSLRWRSIRSSHEHDPVTGEELRYWKVDLRFFRRSDALHEVEGRLIDTKTHPFRHSLAEHDEPAENHLHHITLRLVLNSELQVHAADADKPWTPFKICPGAARALQSLVGLRIRRGWNRRVCGLLGGVESCMHMVELLGPMALQRETWRRNVLPTQTVPGRLGGSGSTPAIRSRQDGTLSPGCFDPGSTPKRIQETRSCER
jgi:hypothetical protein